MWIGLDEAHFMQLISMESSVESKMEIITTIISERGIDHSLQRDLILDQLYSTMIFIIEMNFGYEMAASIFKLVVNEFNMLMKEQYDYGAESRLRDWIKDNVSSLIAASFTLTWLTCQTKTEELFQQASSFKKIAKFISTSMFSELESYHYAFTHLPRMELLHMPLFVDTPIDNFPALV
jgi:hypothetical protein